MKAIADLPLHYGKIPKWLFERMVKLAKSVSYLIISEYGKKEFLKRISNPFFFQAFGNLLGFDWHSSGLTTTTIGALKEANLEEYGIGIAGGKGKIALKTPEEIEKIVKKFGIEDKKEKFVKISKIVARVDNNLIQDGFSLYHHSIFISEKGKWAIVQQGMNLENRYARRYHWFYENVKDFFEEPHSGIFSEIKVEKPLNLIDKKAREVKKVIVEVVKENPSKFKKFVKNSIYSYLKMERSHYFDLSTYKKIVELHNFDPKNFEEIVLFKGVSSKTMRALALLANLVFGSPLVWKDVKVYSFAHGGKDGIPYPVDRKTYDKTIEILEDAIKNAEIGNREKILALKRLKGFFSLD
ncbi:MAG: hypothetical protein B6U78_01520 [Candidatus Aenigmarchaeota archaeon ex4484_224]|nr:MAG: hypothetical protein B6U78_01520 [Candidatus Aenigmarchaeota archaeon ex4484_224]